MPTNPLTDDLRIKQVRPLMSPAIVLEEYPASESTLESVARARAAIVDTLYARDPRLVVIAGPCSIHDPRAALEFAEKLGEIAKPFSDELIVVMRTYFEKPRTIGGWKGLINDPDLDESYHINKGLRIARKLLVDIAGVGLPMGVEFLDNIIPQYIADLVSWAAIGARTAESQIHRQFASGCSMPVGFKNSTDGNTRIAIEGIKAASMSHWFLSVTKEGMSAILQTSGNDACHLIHRGGAETPNYGPEDVAASVRMLDAAGLPPRLMIDCSHGNSRKDHRQQLRVAEEVASQIAGQPRSIFGVMLESNLVEGRQDIVKGQELVYGQSVTDACISIEQTRPVLELLARAVRS